MKLSIHPQEIGFQRPAYRRAAYDGADWSKSDVMLAKKFGVTKQAISAARKTRGIPTIIGHGGSRKGAGRK